MDTNNSATQDGAVAPTNHVGTTPPIQANNTVGSAATTDGTTPNGTVGSAATTDGSTPNGTVGSAVPSGGAARKTPLANRPCRYSNQMRMSSGRCAAVRGPSGTIKKRTTPMSQRSAVGTRRRTASPGAGIAEKRAIEQLAAEVRMLDAKVASFDKTVQYLYEDMDREMKAMEKRILGKKRKGGSSSSSSDSDDSDDDFDFVTQYNAVIAAKNAAAANN